MDTCCIKGCEKVAHVLGLCTKHWRRNKLYGSPVAMKSHSGLFRGMPAKDRFFRQLQKSEGGCWTWTSSVDKDGYGIFRGVVSENGYTRAHRFSYAFHTGEIIPDGIMVLHSCDNPRCVNPDHLSLGTGTDNQRQKWARGRGKTLKGAELPHAILTEDQARAVLHDPRTYTQIAADYKIAPSTVGSIKQRVSWKHI